MIFRHNRIKIISAILGIFISFILFCSLKSEVKAIYFDTRVECKNDGKPWCSDLGGVKNASCNKTTMTCWGYTMTSSSMEKFQKELTECDKTGTMNLSCFMAGTSDVNPDGFQGIFPSLLNSISTSIIGTGSATMGPPSLLYQGGALGKIAGLIGSMYTNPPASGIEYIADVGRNLGIARPAYAQQGFGFNSLSNLLPLWKAFRNTAYVFFILAFLIVGLAIMFRVKISPQAVITIQSAIPKAIIALILITFSYAIAGLLIDIIYLVISLGVYIVAQTNWIDAEKVSSTLIGLNINEAMTMIWEGGTGALARALSAFLGLPSSGIGGFLGGLLLDFLFGSNSILTAVLGIIAFFLVLKLFFSLVLIYVQIIIAIIIGPIQIMMGAIPGSKGGFNSWFRNLFANIMVFPAVALFLLFANVLGGQFGPDWTPPVLGMHGDAVAPLIGFGMLLLITKVPGMVKSALGMKDSGFGTGIGEPLQAAWRVGQKGVATYKEKSGYNLEQEAKRKEEIEYRVKKLQDERKA